MTALMEAAPAIASAGERPVEAATTVPCQARPRSFSTKALSRDGISFAPRRAEAFSCPASDRREHPTLDSCALATKSQSRSRDRVLLLKERRARGHL